MTKSLTRNEAALKARLYSSNTEYIHIIDAKLCVDCENIYSSTSCPVCASNANIRLRDVLKISKPI